MTPDPEHELQELRRANCHLAADRERLLARIETLKTDYRVLSDQHARALDELAALRLAAQLEAQKE